MIEDITAHLQVKDEARFMGEMYMAAASVDDLGDEFVEAAVKAKALDKSTGGLEKSLRRFTKGSLKDTRKDLKKFGALAVFTERGLTSFAITIGTYLAPAILALGNSAGAAATGGGLVAGGGLAALAVGLSGVLLIGKQVSNQATKVKTAWDQQQLAILQYGENSDQAAKASAKLWAVIQQQGGMRTFRIVKMWRELSDTFTSLTGKGRNALAKAIPDVLSGANRLLPTFATVTNQSSQAIADVFTHAARFLSGEEMKGTLAVLGGTFKEISGPLGRGAENVIIGIGRIFKSTAPYVEDVANWFESVTKSFRDWSSNRGRVDNFVGNLVDHFKAWLGLLKELGRTFHILFLGSKEEGKGFVEDLTDSLRDLNDWLDQQRKSGGMARFFESFFDNIESLAGWVRLVFTDQSQAIDQAAAFFGKVGQKAVEAFVKAWLDADWQGKLLILWYVIGKLGVWSLIGRYAGEKAIAAMVASTSGQAAIASLTTAGTTAGAAFGAAFQAAALLGVVAFTVLAAKEINDWIDRTKIQPDDFFPPGGTRDKEASEKLPGPLKFLYQHRPSTWFGGKQSGGMIGMGGAGIVGEHGPEIAAVSPVGAMISPISGGAFSSPPNLVPMSTSDHMPQVNVNLVVDRAVLARAVYRHGADIAARRGENA